MRTRVVAAFLVPLICSVPMVMAHQRYDRFGNPTTRPPERDPGWKLGHTRDITHLEFSPDGRFIVSCAEDRTVRVWNAKTGVLVRTVSRGSKTPARAWFTPDGKRLLVPSEPGAELWSFPQMRVIASDRVAPTPDDPEWLPDGAGFLSGYGNYIVLRDMALRRRSTFDIPVRDVYLAGLARNGNLLVLSGPDRPDTDASPVAYDTQSRARLESWYSSPNIASVHLSSDGRFAAVRERNDRLTVRSAADGRVRVDLGVVPRSRVVFSRDGSRCLDSHSGRLYSTKTGWPVGKRMDLGAREAITVSPDGTCVATADDVYRNRFRLFSAATGKVVWSSVDPSLVLGSKPSVALIEQLSADYKRLGLPGPPTTARLAYVEWPGPPVSGKGKPSERRLAFVIRSVQAKAGFEYLEAIRSYQIYPGMKAVFVRPTHARLAGERRKYRGDSDLFMAIHCWHRGWNRLAMEFLRRILNDYRGNIRAELASDAWDYWEGQVGKEGFDRARAAQYLRIARPRMSRHGSDFDNSLLHDLDLTLRYRSNPRNSVEAEIDALTEVTANNSHFWETYLLGHKKLAPPTHSLWLRGFEAVPTLIEHLHDRRLMRGRMTGGGRYLPHVPRVGEIAGLILAHLAGSASQSWSRLTDQLELYKREDVERWWAKARTLAEEEYLAANIAPVYDYDPQWSNTSNAALLARKYPQRFARVYETILDDYPRARFDHLVRVLASASLPNDEKARLLVPTATTGDGSRRSAGLRGLLEIGCPRALDMITARLDELSPKQPGDRRVGEASELAALIKKVDDPRGWAALLRFAKRTNPVEVVEIFESLNNTSASGERQRHHVEFLSSYLHDLALHDCFTLPGRYSGYAVKRISLRDIALNEISFILRIVPVPGHDWKKADWDAWRGRALLGLSTYRAR